MCWPGILHANSWMTGSGFCDRVAGVTRLQFMRIFGVVALSVLTGTAAFGAAGECGGAVVCACGDRVVEDYTMSADLGPCLEADSGGEIVGLRLKSDVLLDCSGFAILGPDDAQKEEFGIRIGTSAGPVSGVTLRGCEVSGFWWGIYVSSSSEIVVEDNYSHDNGWKDPYANGTGYGIDIARSSDVVVRGNRIDDNGNEGIHLSASQDVVVESNSLTNNGFEQIYLINADENEIHSNTATGGTQGLEMRDSSRNQFSYNRFLDSPKQWLENDNHANEFVYDEFAGQVEVSADSTGNRFSHCRFLNPDGTCIRVRGAGTSLDRAWMQQCKVAVDTLEALTLALERWPVVRNAPVTTS
ncbi:MAG: right-handed parallel beta-helix repeat-containing protein [bacterium]